MKPLVGEHVWDARVQLASFANDAGEDLRKEWGGRMAFEEQGEAVGVQ